MTRNFLLCAILSLPLSAEEKSIHVTSAEAAKAFIATLDEGQKSKAVLPFEGDEREHFLYTPKTRLGLPYKDMSELQKDSAKNLLATTLSEKGQLKAQQIMALEGLLAEIEKNPTYRDDAKYYLTIFGTPGNPKGWAWRFEGHHLSFNLTLVEGKPISGTPAFFGTNPGEVRDGRLKGLRVLAAEEDVARTLISSLVAEGKTAAIFAEKPISEIVSGENRTITAMETVGIAYSAMTKSQQQVLLELISHYTGRYRSEIATDDLKKMETAGLEKIHFGWAGSTKPGEAYYYRIQGPTFLMEACNVQNDANHMHATWRDFTGDFGRDLLKEHIANEHSAQ